MVPNIFQYATKELSQDAVICWLVACAKEASGELRECGLSFVKALMCSGDGRVINVRNENQIEDYHGEGRVTAIERGPCPQYRRIDVYFQAEIDGKRVSFVIEDKVHTKMRSGQLEGYRELVEDDSIEEDLVKAVYLKTGHVFDDERERAERAGYAVFDAEDVVAFLSDPQWSGTHVFVRDFLKHVEGLVEGRARDLNEWNLNRDFVQWKFMVALGKVLEPSRFKLLPAQGINRGGGVWTQYPHYDERKSLFWRLDSSNPLRMMVDTRQVGAKQALAAWDGWYQAFQDAAKNSGLPLKEVRRVRSRNGSAVVEGTIGAVDAQGSLQCEGLDKCLERVRKLQNQFVEETGLTLG